MKAELFWIILFALALAAAFWFGISAAYHRQRAANLERWIRTQLHHIATDCSMLPQAREVAERLLIDLPKLGRVDIMQMRRALANIERSHDAAITESTRRWCEMQAKIAEDARAGEPLPGIDGGAS